MDRVQKPRFLVLSRLLVPGLHEKKVSSRGIPGPREIIFINTIQHYFQFIKLGVGARNLHFVKNNLIHAAAVISLIHLFVINTQFPNRIEVGRVLRKGSHSEITFCMFTLVGYTPPIS